MLCYICVYVLVNARAPAPATNEQPWGKLSDSTVRMCLKLKTTGV